MRTAPSKDDDVRCESHLAKRRIAICLALAISAVPQPSQSAGYDVTIKSEHYVVFARKDADLARAVAQTAEELHDDFFQSLSPSNRLERPTEALPVVCLDNPIAGPSGREATQPLPVGYDSWSAIAGVNIDPNPGPVNRTASRVRHLAATQLLAATLGESVVEHLPFWCRTGLPCYFEGAGGLRLNGITRLTRLGVLEATFARNPFPDLTEFIAEEPTATTGTALLRSHALAWSLCHFLFHGTEGSHRKGFLTFLHAERYGRAGKSGEALFREHIGDPQVLQHEWVKHIYFLSRATDQQLAATLKSIGQAPHKPRSEAEQALRPTLERGDNLGPALPPASKAIVDHVWSTLRSAHKQSPERRANSLKHLARDDATAAALARIVVDGRPAEKAIAAQALGVTQNRKAMPVLIDAALADTDAGVRRQCARAIGAMNYGIAPDAFYRRLAKTTPAKAAICIDALVEIKDPYAPDALIALLREMKKLANSAGGPTGKPRLTGPTRTKTDHGATRFSFRRPPDQSVGPPPPRHPMSGALERIIASGLTRLLPAAGATTPDEWRDWADDR